MQTNSWRELGAAARELGITPDELLKLSREKGWVQIAPLGNARLVARHSIDNLKHWLRQRGVKP